MTAPANDNFADAIVLSGSLPITRTGDSNADATTEGSEPITISYGQIDPNDETVNLGHSVWYSWTPTSSGTYRIRIDSDFDCVLGVYTGASLGSLTRLHQVDVNYGNPSYYEQIYIDATASITYYIQVGGWATESGTFDIEIDTFTRPANDNFASAEVITGTMASGDNTGAGLQSGEPRGDDGLGFYIAVNTVWFKWNSGSGGSVTVDLDASFAASGFSSLAVFTGTSVGSLTTVAAHSYENTVSFDAAPSTDYYIQVGGTPWGGLNEGNFDLDIFVSEPTSDYLSGATPITLTGGSATLSDSNVTATTQAGEPLNFSAFGYEGTVSSTVWFSFEPDEDGVVRFDTFGSDFDTTAAAFTGGAVNSLTTVAFNNDYLGGTVTIPQSQISWAAEGSTPYYIQVGGNDGATGDITAHLYFEPYPAPVYPDAPPELTPADDYRVELRSLSSSGFSQTTASLDLVTFSCNWRLNAPGAFEGTGVIGTIQSDAANVGQRELIVYKGSTAIWGGYLTFFDADEDSRRVRISAEGYFSRARSRVMRGNQVYKPVTNNGVQWKADVIAWDIIDQAQGATYGDMGWSFGGHSGTRYDCKRVYYAVDRTNVASAIETLAREDYFDFSVDVRNTPTAGDVAKFRTWAKRGTDRSATIDLNGTNSVTLNYSLSSSDLYTYIDVFGSVEGCRGVAATDSANLSTYGRLEGGAIDMETDEQGEVDRAASDFIDQHSVPAKNASVSYMEGVGPDLTSYDIGDTIKVSPADGYVSYFTGRVISRELAVEARRAVITVEVER